MSVNFFDSIGVKHPIMQGGMQWLAVPEFAAAVSNAGALGTINASLCTGKRQLIEAIRKTKALTGGAFAVNISMLPNQVAGELTPDFIAAVTEEKVPVVELSGRDPKEFVPPLKAAGIKVIHKSTAVRFAKKAEEAGVDAVSIVGFECGGHPGMDDVTTMVLIPSVVDALSIPVIAGGGICDSRSYAAARCLGADGVVLGTRFVASRECIIHPNFKEAMLAADGRSTVIVQRSIRNAARNMKNTAIAELVELEASGKPTLEQVLAIVNGKRQKAAYESGDVNGGAVPMGECVGRIHDIMTVQEIVDEIVGNSAKLFQALGQ